jgi:DNA-binding IclR family transcriptional regulator
MKVPRTINDPYTVEAVLRALDILEVFDGSRELSLNEVSQRTGLNKSRCFRLLHTLASRKYLERTSEGQGYRLGSWPFDRAVGARRDVREIAHPYLVQLRDQFNETVNLGVIHNGEILYIDLVESQRPFRMSAMVGSRMPIGNTAMGKSILALMTKEAAQELLTGHSVSRALQAELGQIRQLGHAIDNEENEPGVACIGASILDADGSPTAAVSMSGPVHRILVREREIAKALQKICQRVSDQMGFSADRTVSARPSRNTKSTSRVTAV